MPFEVLSAGCHIFFIKLCGCNFCTELVKDLAVSQPSKISDLPHDVSSLDPDPSVVMKPGKVTCAFIAFALPHLFISNIVAFKYSFISCF